MQILLRMLKKYQNIDKQLNILFKKIFVVVCVN